MEERQDGRLVDRAVSRRSMIKGLGIGGGVAAVSFATFFGLDVVNAQVAGDDIPTILNLAATAEALAITNFHATITQATYFSSLPSLYQDYLRAALASEQAHYDFLVGQGAKPLANQFFVPDGILSSLALHVAVVDLTEAVFIGAYLASVRRFAELGNPLLSEVAAQVMGVEAEHRALNRAMGRDRGTTTAIPNNIALERTTLFQVSQAVPFAAPFLSGDSSTLPAPFQGAKFVGPIAQPSSSAVAGVAATLDPVPLALTAFTRKGASK